MLTKLILFATSFLFAFSCLAAPLQRSVISQYGIEWTFDKAYPSGQFANGDYWVVGPVTIVSMTPAYDGTLHGFEINPDSSTADSQSYDGRGKSFNASKLPALPFTAPVNSSIIKAISYTDDESYTKCTPTSFTPKCLQTSAVLTVLASAPPGNGASYLRPPYPGPEKPLFSLDSINMGALARFDIPTGVTLPSVESVRLKLLRPQIDHKPNGVLNEHTEPKENLPTYSPEQYMQYGEAFGRIFFKDLTATQRKDLLAVVLQAGSDRYYAAKYAAQTWPGGSGVTPGKKMMIGAFIALLGTTEMKTHFSGMTFFDEDKMVSRGKNNVALYGSTVTEDVYWSKFLGDSPYNTTQGDPYGYTEGGGKVNDDIDNYQYCCRAEPWRGGIVAFKLLPGLEPIWTEADTLEDYLRRFLSLGLHYQPDPCAPAEGVCSGGDNAGLKCTSANQSTACPNGQCDYLSVKASKYRVTYGPDGKGDCIKDNDPSDGIGRLPQLHARKYGTLYGSNVIRSIWSHYGDQLFGPPIIPAKPGNLRLR